MARSKTFERHPSVVGTPRRNVRSRPISWGRVGRRPVLIGESIRPSDWANRSPSNERSALYSSSMQRAVITAAIIGRACNLNPVPIAGLHERKIGLLSGKSRDEGWATYAAVKERWIAGDVEYTHPGGESYADIRRRVVPIIEDLVSRHRGAIDHRRRPWSRHSRRSHLARFRPCTCRLRPYRHRLCFCQRHFPTRRHLDGRSTEPNDRALKPTARRVMSSTSESSAALEVY